MVTLQEIQAAMTGFPRDLTWANFRPVQTSLDPPHQAQTSARFTLSTWTVHRGTVEYRIHGAGITVSLNATPTWATPTARAHQEWLLHEQGHYDICGLLARDIIRQVLDLRFSVAEVAANPAAGTTSQSRITYVGQSFTASIAQIAQTGQSLMDRLESSPSSGTDGIYDTNTAHSANEPAQRAWNNRLSRAKGGDIDFAALLRTDGVI